jgi:acetoin utilization deacetylase AcuC-like enzyme
MYIIYSEKFLDHDNGYLHPECPERLSAIVKTLKSAPWQDRLIWKLPTNREVVSYIQKFQDSNYINLVREIADTGGGRIDMDTPVSPRSYDIALLAVAGWLDGIDLAWESGNHAFILARPPGHHASRKTGMGFCLFSNAAIAANYALEKPDLDRVAILDWDVHHGNGTQDIVENNPNIAYCSLHQSPCYPGTGGASDRGIDNNVLNIPMKPGSTIKEYQAAFETQVMPFLQKFKPNLLIVSAGYDANYDDPLAEISLQPHDFAIFTNYCLQLNCPLVFGLEGGYDLRALAESVKVTIDTCLRQNTEKILVK